MANSKKVDLVVSVRDRATKILNRIKGVFKKWGAGVGKVLGGVSAGILGVGAALGVLLKKFAEQIDEQAKVAASLGIANEALGVFRDAAEYAGISSGNLTTALRKMSQGVADAAKGTGEAREALERLGLDANQLQQQGPEQAFKAIVEQLSKMTAGIERTNIAMDIFGRSGAAMANLTAEGLRQAQKDADALGLKLTSAQAGHVEAANDAWSKIKNASSDFFKYVTAKLAPGVKNALDRLFGWIKSQNLENWAAKAAKGIGTAFQAAAVIVGGVAEAVIAVSRGLAGAVRIVNDFTKSSLSELLSRQVKDLDAINERIATLSAAGIGSGGGEMQDLVAQREQKTGAVRDTYAAINSATQIERSAANIASSLEKAQGFSISPEATKAMKTLSDLAGEFENKATSAKETAEQTGGSMRMAFSGTAEAVAIAGDRMARINAILDEMREKAGSAAAAIASIPPMPMVGGGGDLDGLERSLEDAEER